MIGSKSRSRKIILLRPNQGFAFPQKNSTFAHLFKEGTQNSITMYWTLELASYLEDAPWPATKDELIDFAMRTGAPLEVVENLQQIEDEGEIYDAIEDIWPDYPTKDDFFFNEDEY
jgi:hypothetical protein